MNKKRVIIVILVIISVLLSLVNILLIKYGVGITGFVSSSNAGVRLFLVRPLNITIDSPKNTTYKFNLSDGILSSEDNLYYFFLNLNVSTSDVASGWMYSLFTDTLLKYSYIEFVPNTTFSTSPGFNEIQVFAENSIGDRYNKSAFFTVEIANAAPELEVKPVYYGCKGQRFSDVFNIIDYDMDLAVIDILPRDFFFASFTSSSNPVNYTGEYFSNGPLVQSTVGVNNKTIYAVDATNFVDSENISFVVYDTNMLPEVEDLKVYKIWNKGLNRTFKNQWNVLDSEDGRSMDGRLTFSLFYDDYTPFSLFEINNLGYMEFTADNTTETGVYLLKACVEDTPLPEENIADDLFDVCGCNGTSNIVCDDFALTISDQNRLPNITNVSIQNNKTLNVVGTQNFTLFIEFEDEDNDALSVEWFINNSLKKSEIFYENNTYNYEANFTYSFPCGVNGSAFLTVVVDDGINKINKTWNLSIQHVNCPIRTTGGGGGGIPYCYENWACLDWSTCQSVKESFSLGIITTDDYYSYIDKCGQLGYNESYCGYQLRNCSDANNCSNLVYRINKSDELTICYYTEFPNCKDGIKNCHDGFCEIAIDCGGACGMCPTCSDGKKNQMEEGIDCGGPCPNKCILETPETTNWIFIVLLLIFLILIFFIFRMIIILFARRKRKKKEEMSERLERAMIR